MNASSILKFLPFYNFIFIDPTHDQIITQTINFPNILNNTREKLSYKKKKTKFKF